MRVVPVRGSAEPAKSPLKTDVSKTRMEVEQDPIWHSADIARYSDWGSDSVPVRRAGGAPSHSGGLK